jgi:radical SAM superfamily enzyme YgiQ (UPF0313 family)
MTHHNLGPHNSLRLPSDFEIPRAFPPLGPEPNVLLVWPRFPPSFWGFEAMMRMLPEKSVLPPLGLITVAALTPPRWRLRLIDMACQPLTDEDIERADLVMVSAMQAQRQDLFAILARCRALGVRTIVGGPYASSQPDALLPLADHVVVGEVDGCFAEIAADLEQGQAKRLYRIDDKPDVTATPMPRFDLLRLQDYASMSVQFSRGCPFQCEFCDIITIYGRRPRTKTPEQLIAELDRLRMLGWRKPVFVVDDNFIGNWRKAVAMCQALETWQQRYQHPFTLYTEASIDLAGHEELLQAMVRANFTSVFIGIESPSDASLREVKKYQNLRHNIFEQIRTIQRGGLWVCAGFIVGFDSDDDQIFSRQIEFVERAAIPWAMTGVLQAPPTTPLYDRLLAEGRLITDSESADNFNLPNFRTLLPTDVLMGGLRRILLELYDPDRFFDRTLRSLEYWQTSPAQRVPEIPWHYYLRATLGSIWHQGVTSNYRAAYWRYCARIFRRWSRDPVKLWEALIIMLSAHHFVSYARHVISEIERHVELPAVTPDHVPHARTATSGV